MTLKLCFCSEMGWGPYHSNEAWCRPDGVLLPPGRQPKEAAAPACPLSQLHQTPRPQTIFLLGVCPHIPHRTISAARCRKPSIRTVNSVLYLRTIIPGGADLSLSPWGFWGLSRLPSPTDLPPYSQLFHHLPKRCWLEKHGFREDLKFCMLVFATRKKEAALHCSLEFVPISTSFTSSFWFIF